MILLQGELNIQNLPTQNLNRSEACLALKEKPNYSWLLRNSTMESNYSAKIYTKTFEEEILSFVCLSYKTDNQVKHVLLAEVKEKKYYIVFCQNKTIIKITTEKYCKIDKILDILNLREGNFILVK